MEDTPASRAALEADENPGEEMTVEEVFVWVMYTDLRFKKLPL